MSSFARDPAIGVPPEGRLEVRGTWPNIRLFVNDRELTNVLEATLRLRPDEPPCLSVDFMVPELEVEVDPQAMDGYAILSREPEKAWSLRRIVVPPEDSDG